MGDNIQTITTGKIPPCLQQTIDKTRYLVEVNFSDGSTQSVGDKQQQAIHPNMENNLLYPPSEKIIQKLFGKY